MFLLKRFQHILKNIYTMKKLFIACGISCLQLHHIAQSAFKIASKIPAKLYFFHSTQRKLFTEVLFLELLL